MPDDDVALAIARVKNAVARLHEEWASRGRTSEWLTEAINEFNDARAAMLEALERTCDD